jgi:hypothetical protein
LSPSESPSVAPSGASASISPSAGVSASVSPSASPSFAEPEPVQEVPILNRNPNLIKREIIVGPGAIGTNVQRSIPSWNTLGRPKNAKRGTLGFNFQTKNLEIRIGNRWLKLPMKRI